MASRTQATPRYHALLVGIDDYGVHPLGGCVNDVDAVQRVLLGPRLGLGADRITRLVAPRPGARHDTDVEGRPATLANLRAALAALGSEQVAPGDRVFLYYSGHGGRVEVSTAGGRRFHREALVPVDFADEPGSFRLLFDHEVNELLRAIAARTRAITVILDCCHAAGTTREGFDPDQRPRFVDLELLATQLGVKRPLADPARPAHAGHRGHGDAEDGLARGLDDCQVVAACQGHELAKEGAVGGVRHGLFTRAFLAALDAVDEPTLDKLPWARIWQGLRAEVNRQNPSQNPWMAGSAARVVFGGPPVDGDPGFPVHRDERDEQAYRIDAGTLADVTAGTVLAIYGEHPAYFPPLGSPEDLRARLGLVRVTSADLASATAVTEGAPFALLAGARGRIAKLGTSPALRYAIVPPNAELARALAGSPLLRRTEPPEEPDVRLELSGGRWFVTDSVHGHAGEKLTLFALPPSDIDRARAVLEHYHAYARPLRMAAAAGDLPGGLVLSVLAYPADRELAPAQAQAADLPEAPSCAAGSYELESPARVCFRVHNASPHRLRVTLVNSAASGKVQLLGDQIIDADSHHVFWAGSEIGSPFHMVPPPGAARCADRMVAIGRTALDADLEYLRVDQTFAQVSLRSRDAELPRDVSVGNPRAYSHWTAAQVVIETVRR